MSRSTDRLMVSSSILSYKVNHMGNELLNNRLSNSLVVIQPSNRKDWDQVVTQVVTQSM
jgi:hypothetical protein